MQTVQQHVSVRVELPRFLFTIALAALTATAVSAQPATRPRPRDDTPAGRWPVPAEHGRRRAGRGLRSLCVPGAGDAPGGHVRDRGPRAPGTVRTCGVSTASRGGWSA